ncbi:MAG: PorV/PorQ family protein [Candidatus Cloacimonetes bacterium]|nr:PorV/PorQ family protein [Candidatus Cloacimonadota bacterium]
MKRIVLIIAFIAVIGLLQAEVDGSKGFQMLRIINDPVTAAQGGNGVINSISGYSYLDNAAAPLLQNGKVVSFCQNLWLFDTKLGNIGYRNSMGKTSFGFAMRYLDYGEIPRTTDVGDPIGNYQPMDLAITFNFGLRLAASHYLGVNLTGLYEKIDNSSSNGISGDIGYIYLTPIRDLRVLAGMKNFGSTTKMDQENIELPFTMELGFSKDFTVNDNRLTTEFKLVKDIDNDELKGSLGVEANVYKILFIRTGYKIGYDLENISAGFGVKMYGISIDYSFNPIGEDLEDVHLLGLSYHF